MRKLSIKEWAMDDQPKSKLLLKGTPSLSNTELLAILINTGTVNATAFDIARSLLIATDNDVQKLASLSVKEMVNLKIKGLGIAKAIGIAAALELGVRRNMASEKRERVSSSKDVAAYLQASFQYLQQEVFAVVFLNRSNKIVHFEIISRGGITGTIADPRIILKKALENNATAIILCHNHPSGNLKPSTADELLTKKIKNAAALIDILVTDHIIVSNEGYYSFADQGMI
ncbi:MAG: DNA repair protein RadC [Sphingobacteriia bacterium]|nr:MAG: DNA repair protein RadC [Sphingobacteriia bacterium]TAG29529.1 MAG: DNA repair protein RadC [Sphingobacteriia bacterium]TAH06559.1 MAG: DNA repair protein RadC [Sphingobacteriia bacterium]